MYRQQLVLSLLVVEHNSAVFAGQHVVDLEVDLSERQKQQQAQQH